MSRVLVRLEKAVRAVTGASRAPARVGRLLVAHNLLLGDTLLLAPLMKALAAAYPEAERVVLARPSVLPLFDGRPYGFRALAFARRDAASQRAVLRSGPYDLALVPDDNRYAWLARAAGARWIRAFAGDVPDWKNRMVDDLRPYPSTAAAWADAAAAVLAPEGAVTPYRVGEWPAPPVAAPAGVALAAFSAKRQGRPYAVLHVGASTPLKLWPAPRWRALADQVAARGREVVWTAGPGEEALVGEVGPRPHETVLAGQMSLAEYWKLLDGADLLLCPDTGIAHLGRVVGVPTIALFGPGSAVVHGAGQFWREAPFWAVTVAHFPCRDQQILFRRRIEWVERCGRGFGLAPGQCPRASCMDAISAASVEEAVRHALALTRAPDRS